MPKSIRQRYSFGIQSKRAITIPKGKSIREAAKKLRKRISHRFAKNLSIIALA
jgi:hypothetical protein